MLTASKQNTENVLTSKEAEFKGPNEMLVATRIPKTAMMPLQKKASSMLTSVSAYLRGLILADLAGQTGDV